MQARLNPILQDSHLQAIPTMNNVPGLTNIVLQAGLWCERSDPNTIPLAKCPNPLQKNLPTGLEEVTPTSK